MTDAVLDAYRLLAEAFRLAATGSMGERGAFLRIAYSRIQEESVEHLVEVCLLAHDDPHNETGWIQREGLEPLEDAA